MQPTACPFQSTADVTQHLCLFPSPFPGGGGCVPAISLGAAWPQAVLCPRGSQQPLAQHVQRGARRQAGWVGTENLRPPNKPVSGGRERRALGSCCQQPRAGGMEVKGKERGCSTRHREALGQWKQRARHQAIRTRSQLQTLAPASPSTGRAYLPKCAPPAFPSDLLLASEGVLRLTGALRKLRPEGPGLAPGPSLLCSSGGAALGARACPLGPFSGGSPGWQGARGREKCLLPGTLPLGQNIATPSSSFPSFPRTSPLRGLSSPSSTFQKLHPGVLVAPRCPVTARPGALAQPVVWGKGQRNCHSSPPTRRGRGGEGGRKGGSRGP